MLRQFWDDEHAIRRHWPWAAVALDQYVFEIQKRKKYDERSPKEWKKLLQSIEKTAHELSENLGKIQAAAHRLADPSAPLRRAHIAWFDELFAKAAAGRADCAESGNDLQMTIDHFARGEFLVRLVDVGRTAKAAIKQVDKSVLARERGQKNPALASFVWRSARTWESLTGRRGSAQRLNSKSREDPDFVLLVQRLAEVGQAPSPSRREIETSLRNLRPPD